MNMKIVGLAVVLLAVTMSASVFALTQHPKLPGTTSTTGTTSITKVQEEFDITNVAYTANGYNNLTATVQDSNKSTITIVNMTVQGMGVADGNSSQNETVTRMQNVTITPLSYGTVSIVGYFKPIFTVYLTTQRGTVFTEKF
jgi:hypothetical protein